MSWIVLDKVEGAHLGYRSIIDSHGYTICYPSPMGDRNARIIAAAPEMLAALKILVNGQTGACLLALKGLQPLVAGMRPIVPHIDIDQALLGLALARVAIDRTEMAQIPGNCIGGKP